MFSVVFLYAVLALTFVFAKKALCYSSPFFLIGFRMILAGSILLLYQRFFSNKPFKIAKEDYFLFFRTALFHIYFAFMLEFWALQYVTAIKSTLIFTATPFISAILAYFLLNQKLSTKKVIGIIVGIGGLAPIISLQVQSGVAFKAFTCFAVPDAILFLAVISGAYAWFLVMQLMKKGYGLGMINGVAMLVGGILSMCTAFAFEDLSHPVSNWPVFLGWLFLLILAANIIFYNMFGWLLNRYTITFLTFAGILSPSFGTIYEWLFFGGRIGWQHIASLVLVASGLYIFYQDELKKREQLPPFDAS
jgi:drug/metabolite transporter (DMT)-like permease